MTILRRITSIDNWWNKLETNSESNHPLSRRALLKGLGRTITTGSIGASSYLWYEEEVKRHIIIESISPQIRYKFKITEIVDPIQHADWKGTSSANETKRTGTLKEGQREEYTFHGNLTDISIDGNAKVRVNGYLIYNQEKSDGRTDYFVKSNGTEFVLNGGSYISIGANNFWISYRYWNRKHVDEIMREVQSMGCNTLRVWGFGEGDPRQYQPSPGEYNENAFRRLDYVVQQAETHGLRLIIPFVNNWNDFGGMNQYVAWSETAKEHDDFYTDQTTRRLYKNYVRHLLTRENTLTGIEYRKDPTIMMWELANEPQCRSDPSGETLQQWIEEMSNYIKSIDSNHLLSTGSEGFYLNPHNNRYGSSFGVDFISNHEPDTIDACSFHLYDYFERGLIEPGIRWIRRHITDAHDRLGKPVYLGEFGREVNRNKRIVFPQMSARNHTYKRWCELMQEMDINGALFWQLVADNNSEISDNYSVFYPRDISTIGIFVTFTESIQ